MSFRVNFLNTLLVTLVVLIALPCLGGPLMIHEKAEKLPTDLMGPFVVLKDGTLVCVNKCAVHRSTDGGKTWTSKDVLDRNRYLDRDERAILLTREGTIIFTFMNDKQRAYGKDNKGKWGQGDINDFELPCYAVRSTDGGLTWSEPVQFQRLWCGALRCMIQLESGRVLLVGQSVIPWSHTTLTYASDDQGKTWKPSNELHLGKADSHDHDGAMEATIVQRKDGSVYMLIRTTTGFLNESVSTDEGMTWSEPKPTSIKNSHCCATMTRLADGRISMLWNATPIVVDISGSREELSIAFSGDDAATWSKPVVIAARYQKAGDPWVDNQVSYPYLCEVEPGVFWITSMFGGLRMKIAENDIVVPKADAEKNFKTVVLFGDSTTAPRGGVTVYAHLLRNAFRSERLGARIVNSGVPSSTTTEARTHFQDRVLQHEPACVVIQFGINDSAIDVWKNPPATAPRVSPDAYETNLRWMVEQLKAKKVPVVLMTTNPMTWTDKIKELYGKSPYDPNDPASFTDTTLRKYNEIVRKIAGSENIPLIDVLQAYDDYAKQDGQKFGDLLLDGMHPNSEGQKAVFDLLYPVLRKTLDFPKVSVYNFLKSVDP